MIHLTGHKYNAREVIQNIFSPLVGVVCSPLADEICHRNNLSFVDMLQPFAKLPNDAHFRDASDTSVSIKGLRLNLCDIDWRPPQTVLARKMLNDAVANAHNDKTKKCFSGGVELELPTAEPWFEHWRETFLTVQFPAEHEFTRHFLSCLIVLSSNDPNIIETAQKLTQRVHQMQNVTPQKLPKWFHPSDVLNSYVLLHEGCSGDLSDAQRSYELLKSSYGDGKCFLVQVNSANDLEPDEIPDYWQSYIKSQPKTDSQADQLSTPKTPQDAVSVISMPTMQLSALADAAGNGSDMPILHPLSPEQEHATEAIHTKFSISSESLASQTINPNVWAADLDANAPHGACLNGMDIKNLNHFVQAYALQALIPYVERLAVMLSEAITNKKGVSKSFLSATKRWFATSKPGAGVNNQNAVIYTQESAELQTRKLGDLYFMFGNYNLAFQAYHQAKRDFNADSAWQYYAGALEMAAVSAFMLGTANRKTYDYMEDAIVCYLTVCKLQQFATRATLLSMECLRSARNYAEAAKQLIRMTSEESDLRSALLLEQAAYCFLAAQPALCRKYAFHIVLSGNRYSRAGQRKHAYRCYQQAYQVFKDRGWSLSEDHIQYTMSKQAYTLKKLEEASSSLAHLLRPGSRQSAQQQANFLKEYIETQNELIKRKPELGLLPHALPQVVQDSIRVLLLAQPPVANPSYIPASNISIESDLTDAPIWHRIEEMIVATAAMNKPFVFKASQSLFTKENPIAESPLAVMGEPIEVAVTLVNTVKCGITISDIDLLWQLKFENEEILSNTSLYENTSLESPSKAAISAAIKTNCSLSATLEERGEKTLYFRLTPKLTGQLSIVGIVGQVSATADPSASLLGSLYFETQTLKPGLIGKPSSQIFYDNKLSLRIIPPVPALSVSFSSVPENLVAGEIIPVTVSLRNLGIVPIEDVFLGCDNPRWISLLEEEPEIPLSIISSVKDLSNEKLVKDREIRRQHVFRLLNRDSGVALKAQDSTTVTIWIQAPYHQGDFTLRLLFYYGLPAVASTHIKYRLVRQTWKFHVHECLRTDATFVITNNLCRELGLNVRVKNTNEVHQAVKTELYVNSLALYCVDYTLQTEKPYSFNEFGTSTGELGERCLTCAQSESFQCRLMKVDSAADGNTPLKLLLKSRLSCVDIKPLETVKENQIPKMEAMYGFLARHETHFFNDSISTEEFNSVVSTNDHHATVAVTWTAVIVENSAKRLAFGQHFVQLRSVYQSSTCPIPLYQQYRSNQARPYSELVDTADEENDEEDKDCWESNENFVGFRCLLEDESFVLTVKG